MDTKFALGNTHGIVVIANASFQALYSHLYPSKHLPIFLDFPVLPLVKAYASIRALQMAELAYIFKNSVMIWKAIAGKMFNV